MSSKMADRLKMLAIVAMGLTATFTLLGGVGTGCIAYSADQYGARFAVYVPSMPLYQVFVYMGVALGTAGAVVTYALVRGHKWAYKGALITLGIGTVMALVHNIHSSWLNEDSFAEYLMNMPTSMRLYITVITLVLFLIIKLPSMALALLSLNMNEPMMQRIMPTPSVGIMPIKAPSAAPRAMRSGGSSMRSIFR